MSAARRVLVAHESEALLADIHGVLTNAGFSVVKVPNSADAWRLIEETRPAAVVFDVALTTVRAFDLIEKVRASAELAPLKIILVASVYNRTAYKRKPAKLYGADDYVEQHHIVDMLPTKLLALLGLHAGSVPFPKGHEDPGKSDPVAIPTAVAVSAEQGEKVRAIAHSIVSDIALYNSLELEAVLTDGDESVLESALIEGKRVLGTLVPENQWPSADPVRDAFRLLIEQMRGGAAT